MYICVLCGPTGHYCTKEFITPDKGALEYHLIEWHKASEDGIIAIRSLCHQKVPARVVSEIQPAQESATAKENRLFLDHMRSASFPDR